MDYAVQTSGRILLPEDLERQALTVLEIELPARQGPVEDGGAIDALPDLARAAGAVVRRDGEWLELATATDSPPTWSDQATAFYTGLSRWVREGEVALVGQDGARWSYRYGPDGVIQVGQNGWDGSLTPFGEPVPAPSARQPAPSTRQPGAADPWADPEPRNRTFLMGVLLVVGVLMIVGVAMLAAGLFG
jgi:hypothetical protein